MKADTYREHLNDLQVEIEALKAQLAEQPKIIQCRDCEHCTFSTGAKIYCDELDMRMYQWDYCSRAERRTDG